MSKAWALAIAATVLLLQACSATPPANGRAAANVTGVWSGNSVASCTIFFYQPGRCMAQQKIGFTLMQEKSAVSGFYTCRYGNQSCLNEDERGKVVDARVDERLLSMRVMMDDGMDCIFNGVPVGDRLGGAYLCLQGAGIMEKGRWVVQREY